MTRKPIGPKLIAFFAALVLARAAFAYFPYGPFIGNSAGGGGGTSPTVLTLATTPTGTVNLPTSANGVWDMYIHVTCSSTTAITATLDADTGANYDWGQIANSTNGGAVQTFGAQTQSLFALTLDQGVVTVLQGANYWAHIVLQAQGSTAAVDGETHYLRAADSSLWFGTLHANYYAAAPTSFQIAASVGNLTGKVVIIPY